MESAPKLPPMKRLIPWFAFTAFCTLVWLIAGPVIGLAMYLIGGAFLVDWKSR